MPWRVSRVPSRRRDPGWRGFAVTMNPNNSSVAAEPPEKSAAPRLAPPHVWAKRLDGRAIKIIGLGGVGTWVAQALVQFLASLRAVCQVWLVDGDSYEESNRSRALFQSYGNKAAVKAAELEVLARGCPTLI